MRQVGHLPELHEDARSEKYNISYNLFTHEFVNTKANNFRRRTTEHTSARTHKHSAE